MPKDALYSNYGNDSFRWYESIESLPAPYKINQAGDTTLDAIQAAIITTQDASMAYFCADTFNYKVHLMQQIVLKSQHPLYLYLFARHIPNADVKALQIALLAAATSDSRLRAICEFARYVVGANVRKLEDVIAKTEDAYFAHYFAKNVKGARVNKFKRTLLDSGKPRYLYWLAQQSTSSKEIGRIEDLIIAAGSFQYVRLLAENIAQANIPKLEQFVLDSGNAKEIKKFARSVKTAQSKHLAILF